MNDYINIGNRGQGYNYTTNDIQALPANLVGLSENELAKQGYQLASNVLGSNYSSAGAGAGAGTTTGSTNISPLMTFAEATTQAQGAESGMVSPMSLDEIKKRELAQKAGSKASVEAQYNPQITREELTGRRSTGAAEGTIGGAAQGTLSSAATAYLAAVQTDVNNRVKEVQDQKAAALAAGDLAAVTKADEAIGKLNEYNNKLLENRVNTALNLMTQNKSEIGIQLQQQEQAFNQDMAGKNLAVNIAQLTGEYNGSPTMAATQNKIQNALAEAGLTGYYNGTKTLEAITQEAQLALQREGVELDKQQLAETIRSNRVQEGLAGARLAADRAGKEQAKTPTQVTNETVGRLVELRNSGQLNDVNYNAELRILGTTLGYDPDQYGELGSMLNRAMSGDTEAKAYINNQANQVQGSDFNITTPKITVSSVINKALEVLKSPGVTINQKLLTNLVNNSIKGLSSGDAKKVSEQIYAFSKTIK